MEIKNKDKLQCADRELQLRRRVYERLVRNGKMSQLDAWREIELMEAIAEDYRQLVADEQSDPDVADLFEYVKGPTV